MKQYFVHLFILLLRAIYMDFLKALNMSTILGYLFYFRCVLCGSVEVSGV
jgi:hypothetical protein